LDFFFKQLTRLLAFRQHFNRKSPVNWFVSPFVEDTRALVGNLESWSLFQALPQTRCKSYLFTW